MGDSMLMERKQKVEINRRKPKVFAIVCLFFVTFATIFRENRTAHAVLREVKSSDGVERGGLHRKSRKAIPPRVGSGE